MKAGEDGYVYRYDLGFPAKVRTEEGRPWKVDENGNVYVEGQFGRYSVITDEGKVLWAAEKGDICFGLFPNGGAVEENIF